MKSFFKKTLALVFAGLGAVAGFGYTLWGDISGDTQQRVSRVNQNIVTALNAGFGAVPRAHAETSGGGGCSVGCAGCAAAGATDANAGSGCTGCSAGCGCSCSCSCSACS